MLINKRTSAATMRDKNNLKQVQFSIIIPVKQLNDFVYENVQTVLDIGFESLEIYVLPNDKQKNKWENNSKVHVVPTGRVAPGRKRDIGAKLANGEFLVFLDDDSFPYPDYFNVLEKNLDIDPSLIAIGGPGITPSENTVIQRASGAFFSTRFGGGAPERYLPVGGPRFVDDWPSVNLTISKEKFNQIGGFNTDHWPGEDTLICNRLLQEFGTCILYDPSLKVSHHRRGGFSSHLKQVGSYGLFRGHFFRQGLANSRKLVYLVPSAFLLFVAFTFSETISPTKASTLMQLGWATYITFAVFSAFDVYKTHGKSVALITLCLFIPSHLWYGLRFLVGFFKKEIFPSLR